MKKNDLKLASIYVGTVIGAGFASGREIIEFFGVYGLKGVLGIIISGLLFSLLGSLLLLKIYNNKIRDFNDIIVRLFGKRFGLILDTIMTISLYTGFSIMISGSGAVFKEELGLSYNLGIIVMVALSFTVFLFSLEGLSLINSLLVPLLLIGIMFTTIYLNFQGGVNLDHIKGASLTLKGNFLSSSLLYIGSNSLIIIIVFSSLLPLIHDKKTAIRGGVIGGMVLLILGLSILSSMLIYYNEVATADIPMLRISSYIGKGYKKFYALILWVAMFTTALANGFGFMSKFDKGKYKSLIIGLFCLLSIPLAKLGFVQLIRVIYPIFGLIGFIILIFILIFL